MKKIFIYFSLILFVFSSCTPNPALRNTISLNGTWQITEGTKDIIPRDFDHTVKVPGLVSLAVPAFKDAGPKVKDRRSISQSDSLREAFWYRRIFKIDKPVPDVAVLKISKAMFGTRVFLNGIDLGEHLPCFTPGYFNVREAIKEGQNELIVRIGSSRNSVPLSIPSGFDFEKDRYIPGIFDNVELILSGTPNIIRAQAVPDINTKQVRIQVNLGNPGAAVKTKVFFTVKEAKSQKTAGELVEEVDLPANSSEGNIVNVSIPLKDCRFWSPETPFLYKLEIRTDRDEYHTRFGMREFRLDTITGMTMLNGKPYFMRGSNITLYRFFEDQSCKDLPWNSDWVRNLHKSFKEFHWNGLRYCIGLAPEDWYRIADEEGFLIQDEFPIWFGGKGWCVWPSELKTDQLVIEFTEWMQERWNHPSVIIWDGSNETVSNDLKTEEIAQAIDMVRHLDLSNRPWDNSYSQIRNPGDVVELHPYHFIRSTFKFTDIATADINPIIRMKSTYPNVDPEGTKYMKIVNEYAWLWLNRDATPTTITKDLYKNLLGENSTVQQRRHLYATYLAAETEFFRCHRKSNAVLHFVALAYSRSDGQTSDHFTDVEKLVYEKEFLTYVPDAFSPVGLMLDEWGIEIEKNSPHEYKIITINDLEPEWKGIVRLQILYQDKVISEQSTDLIIPSFGQEQVKIMLTGPQSPGICTVVASLEKKNEKPVKSIREIPFK